jgi:hypothetical protein
MPVCKAVDAMGSPDTGKLSELTRDSGEENRISDSLIVFFAYLQETEALFIEDHILYVRRLTLQKTTFIALDTKIALRMKV